MGGGGVWAGLLGGLYWGLGRPGGIQGEFGAGEVHGGGGGSREALWGLGCSWGISGLTGGAQEEARGGSWEVRTSTLPTLPIFPFQ